MCNYVVDHRQNGSLLEAFLHDFVVLHCKAGLLVGDLSVSEQICALEGQIKNKVARLDFGQQLLVVDEHLSMVRVEFHLVLSCCVHLQTLQINRVDQIVDCRVYWDFVHWLCSQIARTLKSVL